jgi:hypothetical protein
MGTEQRKWARKAINAEGFLYASDGSPIGPCRVEDASVGGAKLTHTIAEEIPGSIGSLAVAQRTGAPTMPSGMAR